MFEKPKYIVPEGAVHCFISSLDGNKVYGPGEHERNNELKPYYIESTRPHLENNITEISNIQPIDSTIKMKVAYFYYFIKEIVDADKYFNCHTTVFDVRTGEESESLDGEEYVYDICELMIFKKLNSLTLQEITPSIDKEIDITNETYFPEFYHQMLDNAGVRITQLHALIYGVEQEQEGV